MAQLSTSRASAARPVITSPAPKPWWRSHGSFHAPGPGGKVLLDATMLTLVDSRTGARLLNGLDLALRSTCVTALVDHDDRRTRPLLLTLAGLEDPTSGKVRLSRPTRGSGGRTGAIGLITSSATYDPELTVRQNLLHSLASSGIVVDAFRFSEVLSLCGLGERIEETPENLGPLGRLQLLTARSLLLGARVLLVEEPTRGLLSGPASEALDVLHVVADAGNAVVISTCDPTIAARSDRAVLVVGGRVGVDIAYPTVDTVREALASSTEDPVSTLGPLPSARPATRTWARPRIIDTDTPADGTRTVETSDAAPLPEGQHEAEPSGRDSSERDDQHVTSEAVSPAHGAAGSAQEKENSDTPDSRALPRRRSQRQVGSSSPQSTRPPDSSSIAAAVARASAARRHHSNAAVPLELGSPADGAPAQPLPDTPTHITHTPAHETPSDPLKETHTQPRAISTEDVVTRAQQILDELPGPIAPDMRANDLDETTLLDEQQHETLEDTCPPKHLGSE